MRAPVEPRNHAPRLSQRDGSVARAPVREAVPMAQHRQRPPVTGCGVVQEVAAGVVPPVRDAPPRRWAPGIPPLPATVSLSANCGPLPLATSRISPCAAKQGNLVAPHQVAQALGGRSSGARRAFDPRGQDSAEGKSARQVLHPPRERRDASRRVSPVLAQPKVPIRFRSRLPSRRRGRGQRGGAPGGAIYDITH